MRRMLRAIDVRFLLSLTALVLVATICWGFVQRGDQLDDRAQDVASLSEQLADVSADNRRLQRQLARIDREARRDARVADRERALLLHELVRLNRWLREHGIVVPSAVTSASSSPSRPAAAPVRPSGGSPAGASGGGQSGPGKGKGGHNASAPDRPGNAPAHSNAGGKGHGPGGKGRKP